MIKGNRAKCKQDSGEGLLDHPVGLDNIWRLDSEKAMRVTSKMLYASVVISNRESEFDEKG